MSKHGTGKNAPNWKTGYEKHVGGYLWVYCPEHPNNHRNKIAVHRLVMEKHIKRYLTSVEVVHHKNGNKTDNRIENLELHTMSSHMKLHNKQRKNERNKNRILGY